MAYRIPDGLRWFVRYNIHWRCLLTARRDLEDRLRGLEEGGDAYLVKPVDIRELASTLRAVDRRIAHLREPATEQATPAVPAIENGTEHEN